MKYKVMEPRPLSWPVDEGNITNRVSPLILKMLATNYKYNRAYKSYAFGIVGKLSGKMIWIVVGAIAAVVIILYVTGNLPI